MEENFAEKKISYVKSMVHFLPRAFFYSRAWNVHYEPHKFLCYRSYRNFSRIRILSLLSLKSSLINKVCKVFKRSSSFCYTISERWPRLVFPWNIQLKSKQFFVKYLSIRISHFSILGTLPIAN